MPLGPSGHPLAGQISFFVTPGRSAQHSLCQLRLVGSSLARGWRGFSVAGREILEPTGGCQRGAMVSSQVSTKAKSLDTGVWPRVPLQSLIHELSHSDRPPVRSL